MRLTLSRLHFPVTALGPVRHISVWFLQGCSLQYPSCVSVSALEPQWIETTVAKVRHALQTHLAHAGFTATTSQALGAKAAGIFA